MIQPKLIERFRVPTDKKKIRLQDYDTGWAQTDELKELGKDVVKTRAQEVLQQNIVDLSEAQELLYANDVYSVLIVFQAMDAAGKDGTIKHVMSGVNPQGVQVFSFKTPSAEEIDHNFLWRYWKALPERGRLGIFNRSYYEDVLVVRVHPEILDSQKLPAEEHNEKFWQRRYQDIRAFERHLVRNGTIVLKFFLHVSKEEQRRRFMERLDKAEKNWKFSAADLTERGYWDDYMEAYEQALAATSTKHAPWYIIPADHKWATRAIVADIITSSIRTLDLKFPEVTKEQLEKLAAARKLLTGEQMAGNERK